MTLTPGIKGAKTEDSVLYEMLEDGQLRYCRADPGPGAAIRVESADYVPKLERAQRRIKANNEFIGSMAHKTVVILGSGPQLRNITPEWIRHLAERPDISVWCVNAVPKWCLDVWGLDPHDVFDHIVAADAVYPVHERLWGWEHCEKIVKFRRSFVYDYYNRPMRSHHGCTGDCFLVYWVDSITAALSLAMSGMATKWLENNGVQTMTRAAGKIVMLGVEHNRFNHAYTDNLNFYLPDNPDDPWPGMKYKHEAHGMLSDHSNAVGVKIVNGAPWSVIAEHEFVDAEEFLDIPDDIRSGVSGNCPEVGRRVYDSDECVRLAERVHKKGERYEPVIIAPERIT